MASDKKADKNFSKSSDPVPDLNILINLFGDVLHVDVIKSVALNCQWNLETASNILAELSSSVSNDRVVSKPKKKTSSSTVDINTVGYAASGDDDNDVDVLIEDEKGDSHPIHLGFKKVVNNVKKNKTQTVKETPATFKNFAGNVSVKPAAPKPVPNKSKREMEYDRVREHILTGAKVMVLLRGLPGSGKSHLAKILLTTTINEDYRRFVYSTDDFFIRNGVYTFNPVLLSDAHGWNHRRVFEQMRQGVSPIIIDNTNTQMWEMKPYAMFAVQFGYAVEILEPMTVWIFNPPDLARRNIHGVSKSKIIDMLERYEKKITPERLLSMYDLKYTKNNYPPQPRLYPPMSRNIQPLFTVAPNPPALMPEVRPNEPTPPAAKPKKKKPKKKKTEGASPDNSGTISKSDSMHSILTNDTNDSDIDSQNDMQQTNNAYSSDLHDVFRQRRNLTPSDAKERNEFVLVDKSPMYQKYPDSNSTENVDLINFNDCEESSDKTNYSTDLITIENNVVTRKTENNSQTNEMREKTAQLIESCVKLFKSVNEQSNNLTPKPEKSPGLKIDLSSWGLTDDTLISWEVVDQPKVKNSDPKTDSPQPQRTIFRQSSSDPSQTRRSVETNTTSDDFNLLKRDFVESSEIRIIPTCSRSIGGNNFNTVPRAPSLVSMFDKSTMTGRENILSAALARNRCSNEAQHFSQLVHLFPHIQQDDLKEIFDKCQGDINWAVDLLLDDNNLPAQQTPVIDHVHSIDCNCASNYDIAEEQPAVEPADEAIALEVVKTPGKPKAPLSDETLQLKRQFEEQFKIGDTHYSEHVLNLRKKRHGELEPVPSTSQEATDATEAVIEEIESEDSSEEETIELNVGTSFIDQLERNAADFNIEYPQGFQPVLKLPSSLVRQLHAYWLDSVYQQMEAQSLAIEALVREDEEFARKLQEQEVTDTNPNPVVPNLQEIMDMEIALAIYRADTEQWKNETPDDLATRMKRQKLFETFPNFDKNTLVEILQAYNNSFDQTVEVLMSSVDQGQVRVDQNGVVRSVNETAELARQKELIENAKKEYTQVKQLEKSGPKIVVKQLNQDDATNCQEQESATHYREQAAHHLKMRTQCYNQAQAACQKGLTQVASYYSEIAKMHTQKYEQANNLAASAFLSEHKLKQQNSKTLDLHYLYVKEAEQALALFIDEQLSKLRTGKKLKETLFIITGRGSHSRGGVSQIKPVVKRRLKERKLEFVEMNPGLLKVAIFKHSALTNDLKGYKS